MISFFSKSKSDRLLVITINRIFEYWLRRYFVILNRGVFTMVYVYTDFS